MGYGLDASDIGLVDATSPSLADLFRGSEQFIAERQQVYVPFFRGRERVVDLGCGRGEFLNILKATGISAIGVDLDAELVERGLSHGLDMVHADALDYLRQSSPCSFDGVFMAQVIEHLEREQLVELLSLAKSRVAPGGVFVAETVNPECYEALKTFPVDLTHKMPIYPQVLLLMCQQAGFPSARIFYPLGGGFTQERYQDVGEYAVVAIS
jgi:O-antigen chain-terminating methyltransferase